MPAQYILSTIHVSRSQNALAPICWIVNSVFRFIFLLRCLDFFQLIFHVPFSVWRRIISSQQYIFLDPRMQMPSLPHSAPLAWDCTRFFKYILVFSLCLLCIFMRKRTMSDFFFARCACVWLHIYRLIKWLYYHYTIWRGILSCQQYSFLGPNMQISFFFR